MATITVRNLDTEVSEGLKALASEHGRSMEAEARVILATAVRAPSTGQSSSLGTRIRDRFAGLDWDFEAPRTDLPRPPSFDA